MTTSSATTDPQIEVLHTAARRYAKDRADNWRRRYDELLAAEERARQQAGIPEPRGYGYSDEALATFPRYNVLDAILAAVEAFTPADFESLDEARELLATAGLTAESLFTRPTLGEIERRAMDEERASFAEYVRGVTEDELASVEPLPFRRTLTSTERARLWQDLRETWGVDGSWYPAGVDPEVDPPPLAVAFVADPFRTADVQRRLRETLARLGVERLWELCEVDIGLDKEIDLESLGPVYTGWDTYWTDASFTWLLHVSHEGLVVVAGAQLLLALKQAWREWAGHLYSA